MIFPLIFPLTRVFSPLFWFYSVSCRNPETPANTHFFDFYFSEFSAGEKFKSCHLDHSKTLGNTAFPRAFCCLKTCFSPNFPLTRINKQRVQRIQRGAIPLFSLCLCLFVCFLPTPCCCLFHFVCSCCINVHRYCNGAMSCHFRNGFNVRTASDFVGNERVAQAME